MEIEPFVPAWLMWLGAAGMGAVAVAALVRTLEAALDLDLG